MARPLKQGIDYFPLDVHLDSKFKFIEAEFSLEGFAIIIKLLQKIYSEGYWYSWTDDDILIFAHENRIETSNVEAVVKSALKREIFNQSLYKEYKILTSRGIQQRYREATRRRKSIDIVKEYWVIDDINPPMSKHDDSKSTQSKVKNSKVEENIIDQKKTEEIMVVTTSIPTIDAISFYKENFNGINHHIYDEILMAVNEIGEILVIEALKKSLAAMKPSWAYAKSILESWSLDNIKTIEQVREEEIKFREYKAKTSRYSIKNAQIVGSDPEWFERGEHLKSKPQEEVIKEKPELKKRLDNLIKKYAVE